MYSARIMSRYRRKADTERKWMQATSKAVKVDVSSDSRYVLRDLSQVVRSLSQVRLTPRRVYADLALYSALQLSTSDSDSTPRKKARLNGGQAGSRKKDKEKKNALRKGRMLTPPPAVDEAILQRGDNRVLYVALFPHASLVHLELTTSSLHTWTGTHSGPTSITRWSEAHSDPRPRTKTRTTLTTLACLPNGNGLALPLPRRLPRPTRRRVRPS